MLISKIHKRIIHLIDLDKNYNANNILYFIGQYLL